MGMFSKLFGAEKEKCQNHPQKNATSFCISCKKYFCEDCLTEIMDNYLCGSEICKNFVEEKTKQAFHNVIVSSARDLADDIITFVDGFMSSEFEKSVHIAAIYVEMMFLCIHYIMDISSRYLDEEEKFIFIGEIYTGIRNTLAKKYSSLSTRIDIVEFKKYFDDTFIERHSEYLNFVGLNPGSWSEDLLSMSFSKKIADILGIDVDLETDNDIQRLCIAASLPMPLVKQRLEGLKEVKNKYSIL
jgi:hypothetical protein